MLDAIVGIAGISVAQIICAWSKLVFLMTGSMLVTNLEISESAVDSQEKAGSF